jgi:hypothetical protein
MWTQYLHSIHPSIPFLYISLSLTHIHLPGRICSILLFSNYVKEKKDNLAMFLNHRTPNKFVFQVIGRCVSFTKLNSLPSLLEKWVLA